MTNGQLLLVRLVLSAAAAAAMTALRKPLVECIHEGFTWLAERPLAKWQGSYYAFNDVQVRVFEDEDELWFAAKGGEALGAETGEGVTGFPPARE